jgi:hypothetical protein
MECENAVEVLCSQVRRIVFLIERKTRKRLAYLFAAILGEQKSKKMDVSAASAFQRRR